MINTLDFSGFPLTKEIVLDYLRAQPPDRVFQPRMGCSCPLAGALRERAGLHAIWVESVRARWKDDQEGEWTCSLPSWGRYFVRMVDRTDGGKGYRDITAAEALAILEPL